MEAILFNMRSYLEQANAVEMTHHLRDKNSEQYQALSIYVYRRLVVAIYHLQYSAVSSQIGKHEVAISSTKKSL